MLDVAGEGGVCKKRDRQCPRALGSGAQAVTRASGSRAQKNRAVAMRLPCLSSGESLQLISLFLNCSDDTNEDACSYDRYDGASDQAGALDTDQAEHKVADKTADHSDGDVSDKGKVSVHDSSCKPACKCAYNNSYDKSHDITSVKIFKKAIGY